MSDTTSKPGESRPKPIPEEGNGDRSADLGVATRQKDPTASDGLSGIGRRDLFKAFASLPVVGGLAVAAWRKKVGEDLRKKKIFAELGVDEAPGIIPQATSRSPGDKIRLAIIGHGGRGESLVRAAGFAHPDWVEKQRLADLKDPQEQALSIFMSQQDLNIELTGVCDLFDVRAERAIAASTHEVRPGGGQGSGPAKRYRHYQELLQSNDIDAVIIATPDHWHAQMTIDAVRAGKHVYCEKCLTRTEEEVFAVVDAVKTSDAVFQLGHQGRQQEELIKAREIVRKDILGKITLVETTTNRNDPEGAWVYEIHPDGSPRTIDWEQFQGPVSGNRDFSLERFFRWRCWFDYGTGLSGDLLSHEYDAINQILDLGIPKSAMASGGIYFYKDGRDVPDVFQVVYEYPDRELTLLYSATLASSRSRGAEVLMGHDAAIEIGDGLRVIPDSRSTRYEEMIADKVIDPAAPFLSYRPGFKGIDAVTSATEEYFASRGLLFTYRVGQPVSTTHLHIREWLNCIRFGGEPSCNIDRGFEEAITCHMATQSYLTDRKVEWDPVQQRII